MIFDDQTSKLTDTAPYLLKSHKSENPHPASENAGRAQRQGEQAVCGIPPGAGPPSPGWTSRLLSTGLNLGTSSVCSTTTCHGRLLRGLFLKKKRMLSKMVVCTSREFFFLPNVDSYSWLLFKRTSFKPHFMKIK